MYRFPSLQGRPLPHARHNGHKQIRGYYVSIYTCVAIYMHCIVSYIYVYIRVYTLYNSSYAHMYINVCLGIDSGTKKGHNLNRPKF